MPNRVHTANKLLRLAEVDAARANERVAKLREQVASAKEAMQTAVDDLSKFEIKADAASRAGLSTAHLRIFENHRAFLIAAVQTRSDELNKAQGQVDAQERHLQRLRQGVDRAEKVRLKMQREVDVATQKKQQRELDDRSSHVTPAWPWKC